MVPPKSSNQPAMIHDSVLANAIYGLLKEEERPLSASEIVHKVISIQNLTPDLAEKMVDVVLGQDTRFQRLGQTKWTLAEQERNEQTLSELTYTVLDVEIVGHARSPHIIEIAGYRLKNMQICDQFCTFVNPGRAIIPKVLTHVSGETGSTITTELLEKAPTIDRVLPAFFQFIGDSVLVAHNASFDLRMINRELNRISRHKLVNVTLDTLKMSREMIPGVDTQKLPNLAYYFDVSMEEHHLAREDAFVLANIFPFLIQRLQAQDYTKLDQLKPFMITP